MAADPTLADRLDERAEPGHLPIIGYSFAADLRTAAVRLRKLDAALADAGSISLMLSRHTDSCSYCSSGVECAVSDFVERIADALGGTE